MANTTTIVVRGPLVETAAVVGSVDGLHGVWDSDGDSFIVTPTRSSQLVVSLDWPGELVDVNIVDRDDLDLVDRVWRALVTGSPYELELLEAGTMGVIDRRPAPAVS